MLFLPISLAFFIVPPIVVIALRLPPLVGYAAGLLLGGAVSLAAVLLPLRFVEGVVRRLDES
jgi:hypothetical protein